MLHSLIYAHAVYYATSLSTQTVSNRLYFYITSHFYLIAYNIIC